MPRPWTGEEFGILGFFLHTLFQFFPPLSTFCQLWLNASGILCNWIKNNLMWNISVSLGGYECYFIDCCKNWGSLLRQVKAHGWCLPQSDCFEGTYVIGISALPMSLHVGKSPFFPVLQFFSVMMCVLTVFMGTTIFFPLLLCSLTSMCYVSEVSYPLMLTDVWLGLANGRHWQETEEREMVETRIFILLFPVWPHVNSG